MLVPFLVMRWPAGKPFFDCSKFNTAIRSCRRLLPHWLRRAASRAGLNGRQQQGHEDSNNRDHDEQLDEREGGFKKLRLFIVHRSQSFESIGAEYLTKRITKWSINSDRCSLRAKFLIAAVCGAQAVSMVSNAKDKVPGSGTDASCPEPAAVSMKSQLHERRARVNNLKCLGRR